MSNNIERILPTFLKEAIDNEIKRITEEELEEAKKRIDKKKSEVIAGVILHVEKMMRVETFANELRITIITKDN